MFNEKKKRENDSNKYNLVYATSNFENINLSQYEGGPLDSTFFSLFFYMVKLAIQGN